MSEKVSQQEQKTFEAVAASGGPGWMKDARKLAWRRYGEMSWPAPSDEEWRRTDITAFDFGRYRPVVEGARDLRAVEVPEGVAGLIRYRAGRPVEFGLRADLAAAGVRLVPLESTEEGSPLRALIEREITDADNRLIAWHYSIWTHGAVLSVPEFVEIKEPFLIEMTEEGREVLSSPHLSVLLERGARADVVWSINSARDAEVLCNAGANLAVGDAAHLGLYELQDLSHESSYFNHTTLSIERDAEVRHFTSSLGSGMVKTRVDCSLDGDGARGHLDGIYLATGERHMDIRTVQRHRAPGGYSRAFYKGVIKDRARTVYQGLIDVNRKAPKTDAYLTNNNLLLNDGARADSIPSLRINQDDVRCSHGSTTGKVDEIQLFYLQTRGLSEEEAERLLVVGYFQELLDDTPPLVRDRLAERVQELL